MKSINSFPVADMPLRSKLPTFTSGTLAGLIAWGEMQPGSLPWLISRAALYWDKFPEPAEGQSLDEHCMILDGVASLDLLRHRVQCATDRDAVEHLNTSLPSLNDN